MSVPTPIQAQQIVIDDSIEACSRKIVVPIDGSDCCENALVWCLNNILTPTDSLVLLHVQPKNPFFTTPSETDASELILTVEERLRVDSHQLLADVARKARLQHPQVKIRAVSLKGDPRKVLLHEIDEVLKADCVVMGSRGLGKLAGAVLGSVSTFLLSHVRSCPVVIVK
ncbi:hypothetical protein HDU98_010483 [Podochytrium sp. JEL0797]|nr:hypothetical protein HDU98_010483 [Podochytrium sp. JEL0797]